MDLMEKLVSLAKRRGFVFPSSEIYGGLNGCWDYGPLGVELKRNIKEAWWQDMIRAHDDLCTLPGAPAPYQMCGVDCSILMNPNVWVASGHVGGFSDPMQDCAQCKKRLRADQVVDMLRESEWVHSLGEALALGAAHDLVLNAEAVEKIRKWAGNKGKKAAPGLALVRNFAPTAALIEKAAASAPKIGIGELLSLVADDVGKPGLTNPCPHCGGNLTEAKAFNLMFETHVGAMQDSSSKAYLRPETAQGIFVNFRNVVDSSRVRLPFGIGQVGKAFRNEINPRNFTFRSREFEQMEIEFFCRPETAPGWYQYWRNRRYQWYTDLGLKCSKLRLRDHRPEELAHYAVGCADVEYEFPFGASELEGIAHRGDFDLKQHSEHSGKDLRYFDDQEPDKERQRLLPHVIEPSAGADRATLAFLCEAYREETVKDDTRVVMSFHPRLAPIKAAILPLVNKESMPEKAEALYRTLKKRFAVFYDDKGAIGRRYRRMDEAGTPFCFTVDGQTLADGTVTVRDRDTLAQSRVHTNDVSAWLAEKVGVTG